uniref:Uncharacterized protein n=1 Tax=Anopheles minimus TaxID=112268 RepID=A0A182WPW8_9DIPT
MKINRPAQPSKVCCNRTGFVFSPHQENLRSLIVQ